MNWPAHSRRNRCEFRRRGCSALQEACHAEAVTQAAKRRFLLPLFRAFAANADLQGEYREMQGEHAQLWLKVVPPQELRMLLPDHVSREEPQTLQGSQSRKHLKPLLF